MNPTRTDRVATKPHEQEAKFIEDVDPAETAEWLDSLDDVLLRHGPDRVTYLLSLLSQRAAREGVAIPYSANTPYINTIPHEQQPPYPGNREIERRIKSIIRWNAMAMVVRANRDEHGIGGHISTYASAATLLEVGFNHFFHGKDGEFHGDIIFFQGHASPGVYARAFVEGRLSAEKLQNFRRELKPGGGLSDLPPPLAHARLLGIPDRLDGPGADPGHLPGAVHALPPATAACTRSGGKVWCFLGDGEMDEPESLGAITLASREKLDNLIFVVNCNLQRLDGPVRGNGKVIQELEAAFRGAGWNVIKVIWGGDWDPLLEKDHTGLLVSRMNELVDGELPEAQHLAPAPTSASTSSASTPNCSRWSSTSPTSSWPRCAAAGTTPTRSTPPTRPPSSTPAAPPSSSPGRSRATAWARPAKAATSPTSRRNSTSRNSASSAPASAIPISDGDIAETPFYRPPDDSPEMQYLLSPAQAARRLRALAQGPRRAARRPRPSRNSRSSSSGSDGREASTTMAFVRMFGRLLRDKHIGKLIVPIVPDEARTFGLEALFRAAGIYSHVGQLYEPVDSAIAAVLPRDQGRPDPRRGHHRGRRRCRPSSPPAPPTPPTASTRSPSSCTTRCSASSASAT